MKVISGIHTSAADLPADLEDFKEFIRQYSSHEDTMLEGVLGGAVLQVEEYIQRSLEKQSRIVYINGTPDRIIELDRGPVRSITSVKYTDPVTGVLTTIDDEDYVLEHDKLYPADFANWPASSTSVLGGFQIIYVAGLADHTVSPAVELADNIRIGLFLIAQGIVEKRPECATAGYQLLDPIREGQGV
jgi:uncharacterized phiE125 gp8 family phage protein